MGLATFLLLVTGLAGSLAAVLIVRGRIIAGLLAAGGVGLIGLAIANAAFRVNFFGVVHLAYLAGTVTIPMICVGLAKRVAARSRLSAGLLVCAAFLAVGVGLYGTYVEPFRLETDRHVLASPKVTESIKIVVISDIQNSRVGDWEYEVVEAVLAEEPDLVLMAGDLWQVPFGQWQPRVEEFAALIETLSEVPLVMVDGDSDWANGYDDLVDRVGPNALFLYDESVVTTIAGQRILIAGAARFTESEQQRQRMFNTIATAPDDVVTVLLAHRPEIVYELAPEQIPDLTVAGHTHGGQVSVPLFGPPITFTTVPRAAAAGGLHVVDGVPLFVTPGVGVQRGQAPQLRLGVRPSFGVIEIVAE